MAVLQFKFDESYNSRVMCVAGCIGNELEWKRLENRWQKRVEFENKHNASNQQITRFHASHLNALDQEFKSWNRDMSLSFSKKLISLLGKRAIGGIGIAADMDAIKEVFPQGGEQRQRSTYTLCMKQMMVELAHIMDDYFPKVDQVLLIHDHGSWDQEALHAYSLMVDDERWKPRHRFVGLNSMTWKQSVGLQTADMVAYELYRVSKTKLESGKAALDLEDLRAALREMTKRKVPIIGRVMTLKNIESLRKLMESSERYPTLESGGIK